MNEDRLRSALRELDKIKVESAIPASITTSAKKRRINYIIAGGLLSLLVVAGITMATPIMNRQDGTPVDRPASGESASQNVDGWHITVEVQPSRIGPLALSVSEVREAATTEAQPWGEHDIIFENLGESPLQIDDTRTSVFLPDVDHPTVLIADEGCGYGNSSPTGPVEAGACERYLDVLTLQAGESASRTITLFKELPGMTELRDGSYEWMKALRFSVDDGGEETYQVRLTYKIERSDDP